MSVITDLNVFERQVPAMSYAMLRFPNFRRRAVTLSFDDGVIYDERLIEIMQKNGLRGTFNINSGLFPKEGETTRRLTKEQALKLYSESGMEIAVHGEKHLTLTEVIPTAAITDVLNDRLKLEEMFGTIINGMAYPNGPFNDKVVEIIKNCGIVYSRTVKSTEQFNIPEDWLRWNPTCHYMNPKLMDLANAFLDDSKVKHWQQKAPRLFYLWGHSYEFNDYDNWNIIEDFASLVGNREDIWYATNIEIYNYVKAFDSLVFSADGNTVYNPSVYDIYLNLPYNKEMIAYSGKLTSYSSEQGK